MSLPPFPAAGFIGEEQIGVWRSGSARRLGR